MSEFYSSRRTIIADVCGLLGMALGGVVASQFVWETLAAGFRTGRLERAFFIFLGVVLGAAAVGGAVGLAAGRAIGSAWERRHRRRRAPVLPDESVAPARAVHPAPMPPVPGAVLPAGIVLRPFATEVAPVHVLLRRVRHDPATSAPAAESLRRTANIGAWDADRLVGMVRVLGDGRTAVVTDLMVDPDYRRLGIGRALAAAARAGVEGAPLLVIGPGAECTALLEALGATEERGVYRLGT